MTMSPTPFLFEISQADATIPTHRRAYFQERLRNRLYDLIIREFQKRSEAGLTKKTLAGRLQKRPEQITRWLSTPGNLTLDTVSDLLLGICGGEPEIGVSVLSHQTPRNLQQPDWLLAHSPHNQIAGMKTSGAAFINYKTTGEVQTIPSAQNKLLSMSKRSV